jgi:hypothetical protein
VTVFDEAAEECPFFPGAKRQEHWGFPDPRAVTGSEEERLRAFRDVRDAMAAREHRFIEVRRIYGRAKLLENALLMVVSPGVIETHRPGGPSSKQVACKTTARHPLI